ncbi:hypothetical protein [Trujillonella endophytica]|uniref:Glycosyl hydrolases family 39 n=1 Tax=Trujillonella endophytica TaxID=673521 RepID=A0A1H8S985_9ACTN|nr:hypothetical protein [Trujillella endophytica]SEO75290.1 Glycosyl hydrolases family 39 [Trujillella endophytica]
MALAACVLVAHGLSAAGAPEVDGRPGDEARVATAAAGLHTTMGFNLHSAGQSAGRRAAYVQQAADAGAGTVRETVGWADVEGVEGRYLWAFTDERMRLTAGRGISMLMTVAYSPRWASSCPYDLRFSKCGPADVAEYARFVSVLAERYGQGGRFWAENPSLRYVPLAGVEIWNEPNLATYWKNPDGRRYAALVTAAHRAVERVDPTLTVIAGATASGTTAAGRMINPVEFLQQMYSAGAGGSFDAFSHHPYRFWRSATAEQILAVHPDSGWSQMGETRTSLRSVMVANGDGGKKIWATEVGAPTHLFGVSEAEQADLAALEVATWNALPWAGNLYWYGLRDECSSAYVTQCRFGVVRWDGSLKPSYGALRGAFAAAGG